MSKDLGQHWVEWPEIARRLREVRGNSTQTDFGRSTGVPQNVISRYELGRVRPPLEYLVSVANQFNLTLDWLITGSQPKTRPASLKEDGKS